jgi:hypothetical protein
MPPARLGLRRRRRQVAGLRDRVAGARGRHVVRIRINMCRTRWKSRRRDVNASALRAANISPSVLSLSRCVLFFSFFFLRRGFFFGHRSSGCYMYNTIHHTQGTRGKRAHKRSFCFFFAHPSLPFPSLLPFLHVMTSQANPSHVLTYPIASCSNRQL